VSIGIPLEDLLSSSLLDKLNGSSIMSTWQRIKLLVYNQKSVYSPSH
jgi:hypothetical protein